MPRDFIKNGEFAGLQLNRDSYNLNLRYATVANNVIIDGTKIKLRPGRKELSESQLEVNDPVGIAYYFPPLTDKRSVVLVNVNGIYQRKA